MGISKRKFISINHKNLLTPHGLIMFVAYTRPCMDLSKLHVPDIYDCLIVFLNLDLVSLWSTSLSLLFIIQNTTYLFLFMWTILKLIYSHYMDDILIAGTHKSLVRSLITLLQSKFKLRDVNPFGYFLGIQVTCTTDGNHLRQSNYIVNFLHRTKMACDKPSPTP